MSGGRLRHEQYWNQVWKVEGGKLQCKHCGHKFMGGVSRIKHHVNREKGKGVKPCSVGPGSVPYNGGVDNNIASGSSNPPGVVNANALLEDDEMIDTNITGSSNDQYNTEFFNTLLEGWAAVLNAVSGSSNSSLESEIGHLKKSFGDLTCEEEDIKEQLKSLESCGKKRKSYVNYWLHKVGNLKRKVIELVNQNGLTGRSKLEEEIQRLTKEVRMRKEKKPLVLSNELVGDSFQINMEKVLRLLGDDKVFIIGIHGMGGVGKTTLATQVRKELIRKPTYNFKHVVWVTLSQNFSIFKLQNDIAKGIGVKLDEDNEIIRAEVLSSELEKKEKSVLILDDVWKYIDLEKVGVPLGVNGIKLILTSRLKHVCLQMDCPPHNNIISMNPLDEEEAWELFLLKLGYHGAPARLPPEVEGIARSVAEECDGLPLGISVMARTMKGVSDILRWRHALNKLENLELGEEMEEEVFKVLKLSYDNLNDKNMQNCLMHCALYHQIEREELIMRLVEEGHINRMRGLEGIFAEGQAVLDKLSGHSLLIEYEDKYDGYGGSSVKKHPLACHIQKLSHRWMVRCNKGLTEIPDMPEWTADLEKVSLMQNDIKEIPEGTSPLCPGLSTLIFSSNGLMNIPGCFFEHMNALAVLDLSYNEELTCLPDSVSNLKSLQSLLLRGCYSLKYVPPLGELKALSRLDISGTSIEEVPQGLEMLINLKWLALAGNEYLTLVPGSVLSGLINMQYLDLRSPYVKIEVEGIEGMSMLECLGGNFDHYEHLNYYLQLRNARGIGCAPKSYDLYSGTFKLQSDIEFGLDTIKDDKIVNIGGCEELPLVLPTDITKLCITDNEQWRCLCDALVFNAPSSLRDIRIEGCPKLESLFCLSGSCSFCTRLQNLQSLNLGNLESLDVIWKENVQSIQFPPPGNSFSHLTHLEIYCCHRMEKLLTLVSLLPLPNLESIEVFNCKSMKEIFGMRSSEDEDEDFIITLPNLSKLELQQLLQLKRVCRGIIVSESRPMVNIEDWCPNVERSLRYKSSGSNSAPVVWLNY